jgi:hypothetical protein
MRARVRVAALLCGAAVLLTEVTGAQVAPVETTLLVSLINRPVGRETFAETKGADEMVYAGSLDLTERGERLQISSSLRLASDLTPIAFEAKGRSYRFVNVDATVRVSGGVATVTNRGQSSTFEAPFLHGRKLLTAVGASAADSLLGTPRPAGGDPRPAGPARRPHHVPRLRPGDRSRRSADFPSL